MTVPKVNGKGFAIGLMRANLICGSNDRENGCVVGLPGKDNDGSKKDRKRIRQI